MGSAIGEKLFSFFFEYETPRTLHIRSKSVGIVKRLVQLVVVVYIVGYVLIHQKGYQEFSILESAVTTKVKGITYTRNAPTPQLSYPELYSRIWDPADYVIPPHENGAFFVMTNVIITPNQTTSICPEAPFNGSICDEKNVDKICIPGSYHVLGNGMMTGRCVPYYNSNFSTCEVHSWCPAERDDIKFESPLLYDTINFTVLIKNSIEFPMWNAKFRNIPTDSYSGLPNCLYHPVDHPLCPIFRLGDLAKMAGQDYKEMAIKGGVVAIEIKWECNLDYDNCLPEYTIRRLDFKKMDVAPGWNFRFAHYFSDRSRTLHKAFGILYLILVTGRGGKFSILPTLLNIGSGLGLLSLVEIICDIIILHLLTKRRVYRQKKILLFSDNESDSEEIGFREQNIRRENRKPESTGKTSHDEF